MRIFLILVYFSISYLNAEESIKDICAKVGSINSTWKDLEFPEQKIITNNDYNIDFSDTSNLREGYELFQTYNHSNLIAGHHSFLYSLAFLAKSSNIEIIPNSQNKTLGVITKLKELLTNLPNSEPEILSDLRANPNFYKFSNIFKHGVGLSCFSVLSFVDCQNALESLLLYSTPKLYNHTNRYVFDQVLVKTLTSKMHVEVLKILASDLLQELYLWIEANKIPSSLDFYERIKKIAESLGQSKSESQKISLDILAAYSLRGAAIFEKVTRNQYVKTQSGLSLLILATAISYFDKIIFTNTGKIVSLPSAYLKTSCLYGKPYHFWLAAYISNLAHHELKYDQRKSFLASHLLGVGYEIQSSLRIDTNGRYEYFLRLISAKKMDHVEVQSAKVDVVFNSLGAGFGVQDPNNMQILDGDKILRKNLSSGRTLIGKTPHKELGMVYSWMTIVRPHSHINMIVSP